MINLAALKASLQKVVETQQSPSDIIAATQALALIEIAESLATVRSWCDENWSLHASTPSNPKGPPR